MRRPTSMIDPTPSAMATVTCRGHLSAREWLHLPEVSTVSKEVMSGRTKYVMEIATAMMHLMNLIAPADVTFTIKS
ncbi:hypothetical protein DPMN_035960 [Dreissena polymorpha]|uniref:Uncharacterized protein n=1 Tax=Dreissena polymorpha TaxID=45954 RepID=A0A9D4M9V0_DREPO|nr:hypothetical protein DPMN_035960 [Dreissena polymorpha]